MPYPRSSFDPTKLGPIGYCLLMGFNFFGGLFILKTFFCLFATALFQYLDYLGFHSLAAHAFSFINPIFNFPRSFLFF